MGAVLSKKGHAKFVVWDHDVGGEHQAHKEPAALLARMHHDQDGEIDLSRSLVINKRWNLKGLPEGTRSPVADRPQQRNNQRVLNVSAYRKMP